MDHKTAEKCLSCQSLYWEIPDDSTPYEVHAYYHLETGAFCVLVFKRMDIGTLAVGARLVRERACELTGKQRPTMDDVEPLLHKLARYLLANEPLLWKEPGEPSEFVDVGDWWLWTDPQAEEDTK